MNFKPKCFECAANAYMSIIEKHAKTDELKVKHSRTLLKYLSEINVNQPPPQASMHIYRLINELLGTTDLYKEDKRRQNNEMLNQYDAFKATVASASDSVMAALMLCVSGNVIDLGAAHQVNMEVTIEKALSSKFIIDNSKELLEQIAKAEKILYLADNAGEIVLDKLFLETLLEQKVIQKKQIKVAVRGMPIINDVTREDAEYVGLTDVVEVIDNGNDAPGTVLEECSEEFVEAFNSADLIISKGQGNFETLNEHKGANIFFLLIAKCGVVSDVIGVKEGSFLCMNNYYLQESNS